MRLAPDKLTYSWLLRARNSKRKKRPKRATPILPLNIWKIHNGLDLRLLAEFIRIREVDSPLSAQSVPTSRAPNITLRVSFSSAGRGSTPASQLYNLRSIPLIYLVTASKYCSIRLRRQATMNCFRRELKRPANSVSSNASTFSGKSNIASLCNVFRYDGKRWATF